MSQGMSFKQPNAFKWKCGRCSHWNPIDRGACASCGAYAAQFADQFRLHNVLTPEESHFYGGTAKEILRTLKRIEHKLDTRPSREEAKDVREKN
jgi:predicted ATP-dependent serine protease